MTVYLTVFWMLALIALLMELNLSKRARLALLSISWLVIVFIVGLRWQTGNDWANYYIFYKHLPSPPEQFAHFEVGFKLFSLFIHNLGMPFAGFNLIYAAIYLGFIFLSFKQQNLEISGWLALELYSPFLFGLEGTTRQVMAMAICIFSVRYLLSRQNLKFLLCIAIATTFHISALVFLLAWPASRVRLTRVRIWIIFGAVLLGSTLNLGGLAMQTAEEHIAALRLVNLASHLKLEEQSNKQEFRHQAGFSVLHTIEQCGLLALFLILFPLYSEESDQLYLKFYLLSVIILVLLSSSVYVLAERAAIYFSIFQIHLLALLTRRMKTPAMRQLCCITILAISLARLYTATHSYNPRIFVPYKGVLINRDVRRDPGWFY